MAGHKQLTKIAPKQERAKYERETLSLYKGAIDFYNLGKRRRLNKTEITKFGLINKELDARLKNDEDLRNKLERGLIPGGEKFKTALSIGGVYNNSRLRALYLIAVIEPGMRSSLDKFVRDSENIIGLKNKPKYRKRQEEMESKIEDLRKLQIKEFGIHKENIRMFYLEALKVYAGLEGAVGERSDLKGVLELVKTDTFREIKNREKAMAKMDLALAAMKSETVREMYPELKALVTGGKGNLAQSQDKLNRKRKEIEKRISEKHKAWLGNREIMILAKDKSNKVSLSKINNFRDAIEEFVDEFKKYKTTALEEYLGLALASATLEQMERLKS